MHKGLLVVIAIYASMVLLRRKGEKISDEEFKSIMGSLLISGRAQYNVEMVE